METYIEGIKENELNLTCKIASEFLCKVSKIYSYNLGDETLGIFRLYCREKGQEKNTDSAEMELSWIADLYFLTVRRLK